MDKNSKVKVKKYNKSQIRPLTKRNKEEKQKEVKILKVKKSSDVKKFFIYFTSFIALLLALLLYQLKFGSCEFWAAYERNYNKIAYGDENYCVRAINTSLVTEKLSEQIVGQNDAIELIKGGLNLANNDDGYVQMIFHGKTGCGKTLASQIIARNFPNPLNVQKYIWTLHDRLNLLEKVQLRLSKCGYNLVILDDLEINEESTEFIKTFEQRLREEVAKRHKFKVVLLGIFKDMLSDDMKEDLKNFVVIDFEAISEDSFIKCIELNQRLYDIKISIQDLEELKEIDYRSSGCKLISKKLTSTKLVK